jgi:hypothetical protein
MKIGNKRISINLIATYALTIIFGLITVYGAFFSSSPTELEIHVLKNIDFSDYSESSSIKLLINDSTTIKNLNLVEIRIDNNSKTSLQNNHYDQNNPIGIAFNGKLVEVPKIVAKSKSLDRVEPILLVKDSMVIFKNLVLTSKDFYTLQMYIESTGEAIELKSIGNLSSQEAISVSESKKELVRLNSIAHIFKISALTSLIMLIFYFISEVRLKQYSSITNYLIIFLLLFVATYGLYAYIFTREKESLGIVVHGIYLIGIMCIWIFPLIYLTQFYEGFRYKMDFTDQNKKDKNK